MPRVQEDKLRRLVVDVEADISQRVEKVASALTTGAGLPQPIDLEPSTSTEPQAVEHLKQLLAAHRKLDWALQTATSSDAEVDMVRTSAKQRRQVLNTLRTGLDNVGQRMRCLIDDCSEGIHDVKFSPSAADVIAYSQRLRYTTFATLGILPGQPPAPQIWHMTNSALHQFARTVASDQQAATHQKDAAMLAAAASVPVTEIPALPPMPPGWKPGDPLPEVPAMPLLPPMPDGWKPGDPLPDFSQILAAIPAGWKPGDALPVPAAAAAAGGAADEDDAMMEDVAEEVQEAPAAAPGLFEFEDLSFILNPDLEVNEEYSSEEFSDED